MRRKVILVDDDSTMNYINSIVLNQVFGVKPEQTFQNGKLALEFLEKHQEDEFLLFLDINMPVMNGWQFLDAIGDRDEFDNVRIVILTSSIDNRDRVKAGTYKKVSKFLSKPLDFEQNDEFLALFQ